MPDLVEQVTDEVLRRVSARVVQPTATYRVQLHAQFPFVDAATQVPYLRALGVSHVYSSPYLAARPGSRHGYDVCDHNQLNPELGGATGHRQFVDALHEADMGLILDFVPNHMAATPENAWWSDVLENGPSSPYAGFFDIDWLPVKDELCNKVLLPVLGAQYGEVLENGLLQLDHRDGAFFVRYYENVLPLEPKSTVPLLTAGLDQLRQSLGESAPELTELQSIVTALEHLPPQTATAPEAVSERQREKEVIKRRLRELEVASLAVAEHVARNVAAFNGTAGDAGSFDRLDAILSTQPYRLCHWRSAADEINYRRFFDINELAALCMERPEVFHRTHRLIAQQLAAGDLDGLRIDHIDGLFAPEQYLWRLQWTYLGELARDAFSRLASVPPAAQQTDGSSPPPADWTGVGLAVLYRVCRRLHLPLPDADDLAAIFGDSRGAGAIEAEQPSPADTTPPARPLRPLFVVVEKILGPNEPLPESWPVTGTTGYDAVGTINGLYVDPPGWRRILQLYERFSGNDTPFDEVAHDAKRLILRVSMSSELQMLAHRLNRISEQHRRSRDFTLNMLRLALREILACFPVYRIYPGPRGVSERDRRFVNVAITLARFRNPATDPAIYEFIREVLLLEHPAGLTPAALAERDFFAGRFQQVTSPVMAKGVEDTAFYLHFPLASVNEVGGDPRLATTPAGAFHVENIERIGRGLRTLLPGTTHDSKRSEDLRARINVLSEVPELWRLAMRRWSRLNRRLQCEVDGRPAPSRNDEYLFYQTLVGVWPLEPPDAAGQAELVGRLQHYMEKATREAKQRTSWINPNAAYEQALRNFVEKSLSPRSGNRFPAEVRHFHESTVDCGLYNALSQLALRLMSPGVPDIYQGQELWDFSLVDPDNRRPVDFDLRRRLLDELRAAADAGPQGRRSLAAALAENPRDPRTKLWVTWNLLRLRRRNPELFRSGRYEPRAVAGFAADHVIAFTWHPREPEAAPPEIVVAAPRWLARLAAAASDGGLFTHSLSPSTRELWRDTAVVLDDARSHTFANVLSGACVTARSAAVPAAELFAEFPVAVLQRTSGRQ